MLPVLEASLPIFLLILAGVALRRLPVTDDAGWSGVEQIAYWFLIRCLSSSRSSTPTFLGPGARRHAADAVLGVAIMTVLTPSRCGPMHAQQARWRQANIHRCSRPHWAVERVHGAGHTRRACFSAPKRRPSVALARRQIIPADQRDLRDGHRPVLPIAARG